jgi:uncharacterized membrane protein
LYLFCYIIVAGSWISHYRIFRYIKRSNNIFIMLNILFLLSIVLLPIPVVLFYLYGNQRAIWLLYASTQIVTGMILFLMWRYARREHFLDVGVPPNFVLYTTIRLLFSPLTFLISVGVAAFFNVLFAEVSFVLFYGLALFLGGIYRRQMGISYGGEGNLRLFSITDNMTAVAITFLVANITGVLLSSHDKPFSTTFEEILTQLPAYSLSFMIVGLYWISHHHMFQFIKRDDQRLIWLNFAFLLCIELLPIFNGLHATYPESPVTGILYAAGQAATGLMILLIWLYAAKDHRLIDKTTSTERIRTIALRIFVPPMIFLASVGVIFFNTSYVTYVWLFIAIVEVIHLIYRRFRHSVMHV